MIKHFNVEINKHQLELIVDLERERWYMLFPKYMQFESGNIGNGKYERNHNYCIIGTRSYDIVFDCNDEQTAWESWSIFDIKKQEYLPSHGNFEGVTA